MPTDILYWKLFYVFWTKWREPVFFSEESVQNQNEFCSSGKSVLFRTLLLSHWKNEIDNDSADLVNLHKKKNEILNAKNKEEKKHLKIELQYFVHQNRQVALDNIRFIDELFRVGTISEKVIHR